MNEHNFRNQVNVIYGAPCRVIAAGENRNLVQGAMPNDERDLKIIKKLLDFGDPKKPVISTEPELPPQIKKRVAQGSIAKSNLSKDLSTLEKLLRLRNL
ncbi:MAG: hypothetical protein ACRD8W_03435 [Nitrososphaeraceae archaeon]